MEWMCFVRVWRLWCMYCEWVMKIFGMWVGRRTESDRAADGIRLDGGRSTMTEVEVLGYRGGVMGVYILCYGVIYIIL